MKKYVINLTEEEIGTLKSILSNGRSRASHVKNAYLLLGSAKNVENRTDEQLSALYHVSVRTIERLRAKFVTHGFEAAVYGKKRERVYDIKLDGKVEAHLTRLACSTPPKGHCRWTLHLLADQMVVLGYVDSISHEGVRQLLKKTKLSPGNKRCG